MIQINAGEKTVSVAHAVIFKAVTKGELSVRMQRGFLKKQFKPEIEAKKYIARRKKYIMKTNFFWRLLYFLNGERKARIRKIELTETELFAVENSALACCADMSALNANMDMAYKLKNEIYLSINRKGLDLPARYLQFVMTFNPEAFDPENVDDSIAEPLEDEVVQLESTVGPEVSAA